MGPFAYNKEARKRAGESTSKETLPYLPPAKDKRPKKRCKKKTKFTHKKKVKAVNDDEHAVLIVGIDTDMDDPEKRYILVKNTAGKKWGNLGRSQVALEAFNYIVVPSYTARNFTYIDSKALEKQEDEEILKCCILVDGVGVYQTDEEIESNFGKLGDVEQVRFVIREDRTHTRACIIKFRHEESVVKVLAHPDLKNIIDREGAIITRFRGMTFHKHIYDRGSYKMIVSGYKSKDDDDTMDIYDFLDVTFQTAHFTSIELLKENYILTGEAKMRFRTAESLEKAEKIAVEVNLAVSIPTSKLNKV